MSSKIVRIAAGTTMAAGIVAGIAAGAFPAAASALDSAAGQVNARAATTSLHLDKNAPAVAKPTIKAVNNHGHLAFRGKGFAPGGYDYINVISPQLDPGGTYFTAGGTASADGTVTFTTPFLFHCAPGSAAGTVGAVDTGVYKSSNEVSVTLCKRPAPSQVVTEAVTSPE